MQMGERFKILIKISLIKVKGPFLILELLIFMPLMKFISKLILIIRPIMQAIKQNLDD
jgi:hypothetical protein